MKFICALIAFLWLMPTAYADGPSFVPVTTNDQTNSGFFDIGNMRVQWGRATAGAASVTVILPAPFKTAIYSLTGNTANANTSVTLIEAVRFNTITATNFGFTVTYINAAGALPASNVNQHISWIAIGLKP